MPNQSLGITATELFACNPFRILGVPVTATEQQINATYNRLLAMAGTPEADRYSTDFDFPSLPPFKRDETTLKTAYAKLASNGYRCFAYSDGVFSQALNIDDVMLNLEDISGYDCFLRCYMWIVTNDRNFEEPELWVPLAKAIDAMIQSGPDMWQKYFDNRYPESMLQGNAAAVLESFHATFKDIILLPIKEMVRGSMKCRTAMDILRAAKVDVDEAFPQIDIPQANKPKPGEPAPKLKIAVKDGDEYFDVSLGKMVNFSSDSEAAVESNNFAAAATKISAAAIAGDDEPTAAVQEGTYTEPAPAYTQPEPAPAEEHKVSLVEDAFVKPEPKTEEKPVKHVEPIDVLTPRHRPKPAANIPAQEINTPVERSAPADISFPTQEDAPGLTISVAPKKTANTVQTKTEQQKPVEQPKTTSFTVGGVDTSSQPYDPFAAAGGSASKKRAAAVPDVSASAGNAAKRRKVSLTGLDGLGDEAEAGQPAPDIQFTAPKSQRPAPAPVEEQPSKKISERRSLTDIIDDVESRTNETTERLLTEQEEEDNLYTDALIKMLRSNRSNKMMKGVDTSHIFDNGDSQIKEEKTSKTITMDEINLKKADSKLLDASYDGTRLLDESDPKTAIRNKYKNINIDDMLNPTIGGKLNREYAPDAISEYKKEKEQDKRLSRAMLKMFGFVILVAAIVAVLLIMTNG